MDSGDEGKNDLWEVVATASGMVKAEIIAGRLASEGIPTEFRYETAGRIYGITIDGLGEVRILVPAKEWGRAREILSRSYDEDELSWQGEQDK